MLGGGAFYVRCNSWWVCMGRVSLGLRAHHMLTAGRGAHGGFDVASCDINTIFGEILKLICKVLGRGGG